MKRKRLLHIFFFIVLSTAILFAQNSEVKKNTTASNSSLFKTTAASGDSVTFKDSNGNTLLKITDEGTTGSLTIPPGTAPTTTTNKLYNVGSTLYFNGSALGSGGGGATSINGLSDAIYDGSSLFLGEGSGSSDDGNNLNTAIGKNALHSNTSGINNTATGYEALYSNTTGNNNTANGYQALNSNTTGTFNVANGILALYSNTTGNNNTAVGYGADVSSGNLTDATAIGSNAKVSKSYTIQLGDNNITHIYAKVGITATSDSTKKENFLKVDGEKVLEKYRNFNLRSWNFKGDNPKTDRHYGIMAQVFYSAFGHDKIGTIGNDTTINIMDETGVNMIAIQALEKRSDKQASRIEELEKQNTELKMQNDEIKKLYTEIKKQNTKLNNEFESLKLVVNKLANQQDKVNVTYK